MEENLSLPIDVKPFRVRAREAWAAFHTFRLSADGVGLKQKKEE